MRRLIPATLIVLLVCACGPGDDNGLNTDLANRVEPAPGPDLAHRVATLTLAPAVFRVGEQVSAHGSFPQPIVLSGGLGCPDPSNQSRTVDPDRSYSVVFVERDEQNKAVSDVPVSLTSLPYDQSETGSWREKDFPPFAGPQTPGSLRGTIELQFVQHTCKYQNSVGIPVVNRNVIVSLPYRLSCEGGTNPRANVCRYVRDDG